MLDVAFPADQSRLRASAAWNVAVLRHLALNFPLQQQAKHRSIRAKRLRAG